MFAIKLIAFVYFLSFSDCEVPQTPGPVQLLDFSSNDEKTVLSAEESIEKLFMDPLVYDRDVVVVSIAGAFRKGKSFLMNYMLRFLYANYKSVTQPNQVFNETSAKNWIGKSDEALTGFPWKSSTKRETVGIVFWSDIFLYDAPNGDKIAIYLMDTQGLFDHNSSPTDNIRIFSLSALMSSVQMMNIFSTIEESHLEYLQFATEIARFTAVEDDSFSKPFQKLMFVIRDWISPEEFDYGFSGGNKFIKKVLAVKDFHTVELKTVREHLQKTFESIECFLMPYPGKIVARNSSYDGRWSEIDEDFIATLNELFPIILSPTNLTVKTINGVPIKAYELFVYVRQYVDLFKSEKIPEAKSIYESTLDRQFQLLISKAVEVYLEAISLYQEQIKHKSEVDHLHNVSKSVALKFFDQEKKFGGSDDTSPYHKELQEKIEKAFMEWKPVTIEFLEKIESEQSKAEEQNELASKAEKRDQKAKKASKTADENYLKLKKESSKAHYDTEESRREAEVILQKLAEAERERNQASINEQKARKFYEEMKLKAEKLEQQLTIERQKNSKKVQQKVVAVQKRDGILQWFGNGVSNFFGCIKTTFKRVFMQW